MWWVVWGDEEFAVSLPHCPGEPCAVAERSLMLNQLLRIAAEALCTAKTAGRNRFVFADFRIVNDQIVGRATISRVSPAPRLPTPVHSGHEHGGRMLDARLDVLNERGGIPTVDHTMVE